jgi:hypothetical protein
VVLPVTALNSHGCHFRLVWHCHALLDPTRLTLNISSTSGAQKSRFSLHPVDNNLCEVDSPYGARCILKRLHSSGVQPDYILRILLSLQALSSSVKLRQDPWGTIPNK